MKILLTFFGITAVVIFLIYFYKFTDVDYTNKNLIIISVDTLRADHMGIYGYSKPTTPNIDNWAKDAYIFKNMYTLIPVTFHSFFTLFSGTNEVLKTEIANRYYMHSEGENIFTLPKILQKNQYKTGAIITNPVVGETNLSFFKDGFHNFDYINTSGIQSPHPDISTYLYDFDNARKVSEKGVTWIKKNKGSKFFLWLHYTTPHMPYNPPKQYLCKIDKNCDGKIYNLLTNDFLTTTTDGILKSCSSKSPPNEILQAVENLYDAEIRSVDEQIGVVLQEIKKLNLSKETVIVFYADHGEGFENNIFGHGDSVYNSAVRIPFIIHIPSTNKSKGILNKIKQFLHIQTNTELVTNNSLYDNSDILPTILDILKIPYNKKDFDGNTFSDFFETPSKNSGRKYIYTISTTDNINKRAIFDGRYKFIQSSNNYCMNRGSEELYDLKVDPNESKNIIYREKESGIKYKNLINEYTRMNGFPDFIPGNVYNNNSLKQEETVEKLKSLGY